MSFSSSWEFIPDSTMPFHWETSYLCLIASPWPGWKFRWCCHRNPLFIPDRTFWKSVNFQPSKTLKSRGKSMVFSTHSSGLTLTDTFGAFRHKQDSILDIQITQYVAVDAFNGQKVATICRFSAFQDRLRTFAISCGLVHAFVYILFLSKVPAGINSAESQNYG